MPAGECPIIATASIFTYTQAQPAKLATGGRLMQRFRGLICRRPFLAPESIAPARDTI